MATKIGINGFGRIGRMVFRALMEKNPNLMWSPSMTSVTQKAWLYY